MERERVDVRLVLEACETVVHEPVRGLVTTHRVDNVEELRVRPKAPVVLRDLWGGEILPGAMNEMTET